MSTSQINLKWAKQSSSCVLVYNTLVSIVRIYDDLTFALISGIKVERALMPWRFCLSIYFGITSWENCNVMSIYLNQDSRLSELEKQPESMDRTIQNKAI